MKVYRLFALFLCIGVNITHAQEMSSVLSIVSLYQNESRQQFGREIKIVTKANTLQGYDAYASFSGPDDSPLLTFSDSILKDFNKDEIAFITCHELGHFFGNKSLGSYQVGEISLAYEAEADFFAGSCLIRYLTKIQLLGLVSANKTAMEITVKVLEKLHLEQVNIEKAQGAIFNGVDDDYPDQNCRALTVKNGILKIDRPKCWYNP